MMNELELAQRHCDICGLDHQEDIWSFEHIAKTAHNHFLFKNKVVLCPNCGFSYINPCPTQDGLNKYYADALSYYQNQDVAYSPQIRIDLAKRYINQNSDVIEIGSNRETDFHQECSAYFKSFQTIELKPDCNSHFSSTNDVPNNSCDAVLHFYVLEHVSDPRAFLKQAHDMLRDEGVMICEVPSTRNYPNYIGDFIFWEHLSHFTLKTLAQLAQLCGFELISDESLKCSHACGFSAVFKKTQKSVNKLTFDPSEYRDTKASYQVTMQKKDFFFSEINRIRRRMLDTTEKGEHVVLWGVNDIMRRLVLNWDRINDRMTFVDDDPRKADFLDNLQVHQPETVKDRIQSATLIVLTTERFRPVILEKITKAWQKEFVPEDVEVIDWNR